ncbi:hypothetical protein LTR78_003220 [Recurvomyces mirabilis]|uniref:Uncharacterized protein n=1 Tax=Recurvomyces mirabilis TaxID=574656 RepID=A0AAE1C3P9_9PEZI|nr:hypothetical protein LTR78_003220 [Recurvomyces mirabilis]
MEEPLDILTSIGAVGREANKLADLIESVLKVYDILGAEYHDIPLRIRARTADHGDTELAHQQFALNDMILPEDPLMADVWHTVRLIRECQIDLRVDPDELTAEKLEMILPEDPLMADVWHTVRLIRECQIDLRVDPDELTAEKLDMISAGRNKARINYSLSCASLFELKTSVAMVQSLGGIVLENAQADEVGDDETASTRAVMVARIIR